MKRMATLFVLAGMVALVVAAGAAFAATVINCQVSVPCLGTDGPDELYGTAKYDRMEASQGDDLLYGRRGPDLLMGDDSGQPTSPTDGNDQLYGNRGRDDLYGDGGSDLLNGGHGNDYIDAAEYPLTSSIGSEDTVIAGGGDDDVSAYDWHFDTIDCGDGSDRVTYDAGLDEISENCETANPGS